MPTLFLRLVGPMQSWGTTSRFDERDTQLEPSKSGVLGVVCAALGRDRSEPVDDLARLRMGVRADREGVVMRDYQTSTGVLVAGTGKADATRTVVSERYFLADAGFLVGLEGDDESLLHAVSSALRSPVWPLYLGRKAMVPSLPVWLDDDIVRQGLAEALAMRPRVAAPQLADRDRGLRTMLEHPREGSVRYDQPLGPYSERRFGSRLVLSGVIHDVPESTAPERT
jgi:CRISPR system Cascade subunit CasD